LIENKIVLSKVRLVAENKSFGNAIKGTPGTVFEINSVKFIVLDKKQGKNRIT